jgi:hypothetical protein
MYCIYTDTETDKGNPDHIVPLSLGGCDEFTIWCDRDFNSRLGTKIDGAIANDPFVKFARRNANARGHSGADPTPVWKHCELDGKPVQVRFGLEKIEVWDPREQRVLEKHEVDGQDIRSRLKIDLFAATRFLSKVALASAYFVYGDLARTAINCDELRKLVFLDPVTARNDPKILKSKTRISDLWHTDLTNNPDAQMYRFLSTFTHSSTVICVPQDNSIGFHLGVLGEYIGSIFCDANTKNIPLNAEEHDLGHVLVLGRGKLLRSSFRSHLEQSQKFIHFQENDALAGKEIEDSRKID